MYIGLTAVHTIVFSYCYYILLLHPNL